MSRVQITFRELLPDEALCAYARRELAQVARYDEAATCHAVVHRVALPGRALSLVHATVGLSVGGRERSADAVAASALEALRIAFQAARIAFQAARSDAESVRRPVRLRRARTATSRLMRHRLHA